MKPLRQSFDHFDGHFRVRNQSPATGSAMSSFEKVAAARTVGGSRAGCSVSAKVAGRQLLTVASGCYPASWSEAASLSKPKEKVNRLVVLRAVAMISY
jgi:hypothetical protein